MPSISYWSQLYPSPRTQSVADSLAARVRDPAWFLARQWQLGEFQGADAGSPAFVRIGSHVAKLATTKIGAATAALGDQRPLEPLVEAEPFAPDLATRVELGQSFEALLTQNGVAASVRDQFRAAYPIASATGTDAGSAAFLRICAGRAVDGAALYVAAKAAANNVPATPALDGSVLPAARKALAAFVAWVVATWGDVGTAEPAGWNATHLEYEVAVTAPTAGGGSLTLAGSPDALAELDWYSFDLAATTSDTAPAPNAPVTTNSVIPGHVRFRGMPNARWWDFEGSKTDFGAIIPDTRDLAKLLFMDFLLLHGDDWFLAPLAVPTGALCWIDSLTVEDVFGVATSIERADAGGGDWTMFSTTDAKSGAASPFLMIPASAAASSLVSDPLEDVHLLRDDTADLAWAIEHVAPDSLGRPATEGAPPPSSTPANAPAALVYQLQTPLPPSWYPMVPQRIDGAVTLLAGTVEGQPPPRGRIVTRLSAPGFQLPDAEVPRSGVRVQRVACRARAADGHAHLWLARRTRFGAGAASSGLRYDLAVP